MSQSRQLAAIMFTDIVGYTALMDEDEQRAFELLKKNRQVQRPLIEKYNGKWLKEMGDGVLASFTTVTDAVYCAAAIQKTCEDEPDLNLRIGIHQGEVVFDGEDVFGSGVNIASRLEPLAPIGGILVSESVHRNLGNKTNIVSTFIREEQLKNVKEPIRIYSVQVEGVEPVVTAEPFSAKQQTSPTTRNPKRIVLMSLAVIAVVALAYFFYPDHSPDETQIVQPEIINKSIAVLPFVSLSTDPEKQYLADGVMDAILLHLSKIENLRVVTRTSVERYRNTTMTIPEIAKELNVHHVLEGSFQKHGNIANLIVQLSNAQQNEDHLWADEYNRDWSDIFAVQSEVSQAIARELKAVITPEEKQLIEKIPTSNLTAYDFYQRGRDEQLNYSLDNKEALERAEDLFRKALEYDSAFAQAYTGLANVYQNKHFHKTFLTENFLDSMLVLANIALSFDDQLAEAYIVKGNYYFYNSNSKKAKEEYDQAIKFNPNIGEAYWMKGRSYDHDDLVEALYNFHKAASLLRGPRLPQIYRQVGRTYALAGFKEKAIHYTDEALILDGDSATYYSALTGIEDGAGNPQKSIEFGELSYAMDSTDLRAVYLLGLQHSYLGENEEYLKYMKIFDKILETEGLPSPFTMFRIGHAYWINGYKKEAKIHLEEGIKFYNKATELGRYAAIQNLQTFYSLAGYYAFNGDRDKAYKYLRLINQRHRLPIWIEKDIKNDPLLDSIREDPEFQKIAKELIAKYQSEHERVQVWLEKEGML